MGRLLVISSAPSTLEDGVPFLDIKFVEGMRRYSELWDGEISCILKMREDTFPFGKRYTENELPFNVIQLPAEKDIGIEDIEGHDVILCSGDNHKYLHVANLCAGLKSKLAYIIEYIPETRRQIIFLEPDQSLPKKIYSLFWVMRQEFRRRQAFRKADGIQANGYPAHAHYSPLNPNTVLYLDSRIDRAMFATEKDMASREEQLLGGGPIRLVHSGRLEHLKGSHDLLPIARRLAAKGVNFTLDIFGAGSLEADIRQGIVEHGLEDKVRLNGVIDFETELVPFAKQNADIYLSCHRQSDPSCSYLENMGCGLAVVGYSNRMWAALCQQSSAGWVVPLGDNAALADAIIEADKDRSRLVAYCRAAHSFATAHSFENEFEKRINHLADLNTSA